MEILPESGDTSRWTPRRKAEVAAAVTGGLLSVNEACDRYHMTVDELASWRDAFKRQGLKALRVTYTQHYRRENKQDMGNGEDMPKSNRSTAFAAQGSSSARKMMSAPRFLF